MNWQPAWEQLLAVSRTGDLAMLRGWLDHNLAVLPDVLAGVEDDMAFRERVRLMLAEERDAWHRQAEKEMDARQVLGLQLDAANARAEAAETIAGAARRLVQHHTAGTDPSESPWAVLSDVLWRALVIAVKGEGKEG